jgi:mono/diheme cytochrome c family protein
VRGLCLSPDGRFAYATHVLGHYQVPTTQLDRGWMCTNALSVIDLQGRARVNTVLLDDVDLGAANPWGVGVSPDGKVLAVAHAGSHEVSLVDRAGLHDRLARAAAGEKVSDASATAEDVPSDLGFLVGLRRRVKLSGRGPRGLAFAGARLCVAECYSDSLGIVELRGDAPPAVTSAALGPPRPPTAVRRGEMLFNDADQCFQKWQSCASCHPDGRVDGLNWDLMNDGFGNRKNTRTMLLAHRTPPSMSLGVRASAEIAVRAGFKFIQFTHLPEEECVAVDEYLRALAPVPSPRLADGRPGPAARRGAAAFEKAGCSVCHPPPLFTDLRLHDVGTGLGVERDKAFDTPTLVEVWRTAPYLHDGRAATIREVLARFNAGQRHGRTDLLGEAELADLEAYVLSQ